MIDWMRVELLQIILYVVGAALISRLVLWVRNKVTTRIDQSYHDDDALVRSEAAKHRYALAQVISWFVLTVLYVLVAMEVVKRLGFEIAGLVAPAAVLGAALGFGAQRVVQDLLQGFFIITERQYGFGDVVRLDVGGSSGAADGIVEDVTLRITRVRSADGEVITVPNGQILKVTNLSKDWARAVVDIPIKVDDDLQQINLILRDVCMKAFADRKLRPLLLDEPSVMGVESIGIEQIHIRMVARTLPGKQFQVGRDLRIRVAGALRREGVRTDPEVVVRTDPELGTET